jgi:hypothetical protein
MDLPAMTTLPIIMSASKAKIITERYLAWKAVHQKPHDQEGLTRWLADWSKLQRRLEREIEG